MCSPQSWGRDGGNRDISPGHARDGSKEDKKCSYYYDKQVFPVWSICLHLSTEPGALLLPALLTRANNACMTRPGTKKNTG